MTFGVINLGDVATGLLEVKLTGANAADFRIDSNNCLVLAPLGTCTVTVVFRPSLAAGPPATATLVVTDPGAAASSVSAALTGTPVSGGHPSITSTTSDLGSVPVGSVGASVDFPVANYGDVAGGPLTVTVSNPEFVITRDTCTGTTLAKGETCTISIALKPITVGVKVAALLAVPIEAAPSTSTRGRRGRAGRRWRRRW